MKNSVDVFFFIDEDMLSLSSISMTGSELKKLMEERSGKLITPHVCRCESSEMFLDSLRERLKSPDEGRKAVYVIWGREPDILIERNEEIKLLMEKGRKEMGWSFVFMGNSDACRKLSQKTGLSELTNIRHSSDSYGVKGALRCCADIVGRLSTATA